MGDVPAIVMDAFGMLAVMVMAVVMLENLYHVAALTIVLFGMVRYALIIIGLVYMGIVLIGIVVHLDKAG